MQRPLVSNGKPDSDPFLDELLNQHLLHERITNEAEHPPEILKSKQRLRSFGLTGLLIFCSAAAIQIIPTDTLTWLLAVSLGLFALNIPLLCLALMFEYWQTVYNQYDHLQRHTRFANMMFIVEYLCVMMTIFGAAVLFADAHWILGLIFFISTYFACWLYVAWSDSLSTNRHTT